MYVFVAENESETDGFAEQIAQVMFPGMVITLDGELGAGKTRFVQAIAKFLGISSSVVSPTFTLIREYDEGRIPLYHMDMYRLDECEASGLGLEEYFFGKGVCCIEWGTRIPQLLPEERLSIEIEIGDHQQRKFICIPRGLTYEKLCECIKLK